MAATKRPKRPKDITLRDYFAGQAITGLLGSFQYEDWSTTCLAKEAYRIADRMLSTRIAMLLSIMGIPHLKRIKHKKGDS